MGGADNHSDDPDNKLFAVYCECVRQLQYVREALSHLPETRKRVIEIIAQLDRVLYGFALPGAIIKAVGCTSRGRTLKMVYF
jgi:hypothetical protein